MSIINKCHVAELNIVSGLVCDDAEELILIGCESGSGDTVGSQIRRIIPIDDCSVPIDRVCDIVSEDWRRITTVTLKVRC